MYKITNIFNLVLQIYCECNVPLYTGDQHTIVIHTIMCNVLEKHIRPTAGLQSLIPDK